MHYSYYGLLGVYEESTRILTKVLLGFLDFLGPPRTFYDFLGSSTISQDLRFPRTFYELPFPRDLLFIHTDL